MSEPTRELMKIPEVARRLRCSESFAYGLIATGGLKHYRLGKGQGGIRVSEGQLLEYLQGRERGGDGPLFRPPIAFTHRR